MPDRTVKIYCDNWLAKSVLFKANRFKLYKALIEFKNIDNLMQIAKVYVVSKNGTKEAHF